MAKVPGLSQGLNIFPASLTDGHADQLILSPMHPGTNFPDECQEFPLGQPCLKHAILLGKTVFLTEFVDMPKPFGVSDIVHNQVGSFGWGSIRSRRHRIISR